MNVTVIFALNLYTFILPGLGILDNPLLPVSVYCFPLKIFLLFCSQQSFENKYHLLHDVCSCSVLNISHLCMLWSMALFIEGSLESVTFTEGCITQSWLGKTKPILSNLASCECADKLIYQYVRTICLKCTV